jgi:membrane-associated phospholipid phosphatase
MSYLKQISAIGVFLTGSAIFILSGMLILWFNSKTELHISLNILHNSFLDNVFPYLTHIGDGIFVAVAMLIVGLLKFKKFRWSYLILGLGTFVLSGLAAQFLKRSVFPDAYRPVKFIGKEFLSLVENVEMYEYYSFPSGHATAAFSLFVFLAFTFAAGKKAYQLVFLTAAILVSYSRVYLSQHFLEDIIAGAIIGLSSFLLILGICRIFKMRL